MATKTLTVDLEAYDLLARLKRPGQSFSAVIKERLGSNRTAKSLLDALPEIAQGVSDETLERFTEEIRRRRRSPVRARRL